MISQFEIWLNDNCAYGAAGKRDVTSRLRRAHKLLALPEHADMNYLYELQQTPTYKALSVSVRSQIKKAILMYFEFLRSNANL